MKKYNYAILIVFSIFVSLGAFAQDEIFNSVPNVRSSQIKFGTEPTKTNYSMLTENLQAIVKKAVTGKGAGVLTSSTPSTEIAYKKYIDLFKKNCPECLHTMIRESHGRFSHKFTFPDGFYLVASIDPGALEWQTIPETAGTYKKNQKRIQKFIFELGDEAGVPRYFDGAGGHVSNSGYAGDSFWMSNQSKYRANNYHMDWGFFGKDDYNANIVKRWALDQQEQFASVHIEHNKRWDDFLRDLEKNLDDGNATNIFKSFQNRKSMPTKELLEKLSVIYDNPKQDVPWLGKRSKSKYVALRADPKREMFENRAIRPQRNAGQLVLQERFFEKEAWMIKDIIDGGGTIDFEPGAFKKMSQSEYLTKARQNVEMFGQDWNDFKQFRQKRDVLASSKSSSYKFEVKYSKSKMYGAAKRDELFKRAFNKLNSSALTNDEIVFMGKLVNEMSYVESDAVKYTAIYAKKLKKYAEILPNKAKMEIAHEIAKMSEKFIHAQTRILSSQEKFLKSVILKNILSEDISSILDHYARIKNVDIDSIAEFALKNVNGSESGIKALNNYSSIVLAMEFEEHTTEKSKVLLKKYLAKVENTSLEVIPNNLSAMLERAKWAGMENSVDNIYDNLTDVFKTGKKIKVSAGDFELAKILSEERPSFKKQILSPYADMFEKRLAANGFGEKNFYEVLADYDNLIAATPYEDQVKVMKKYQQLFEVSHTSALAGGDNYAGRSMPEDLKFLLKKIDKSVNEHCAVNLRSY